MTSADDRRSGIYFFYVFFFFSSRRRHTRSLRDWSSDVCSSDLLHLRDPHRRRLFDEHVQARLERRPREGVVRRHWRRDDDGVDVVRDEQLFEVPGELRVWMAVRELRSQRLARVAEPGEVGDVVEDAREVPAPVAEPDLAHPELRLRAHNL